MEMIIKVKECGGCKGKGKSYYIRVFTWLECENCNGQGFLQQDGTPLPKVGAMKQIENPDKNHIGIPSRGFIFVELKSIEIKDCPNVSFTESKSGKKYRCHDSKESICKHCDYNDGGDGAWKIAALTWN